MNDILNYYSDKELDEIFDTDKATNSFESLTPLLIHKVLKKDHVGPKKKITQVKLLELLTDQYEVQIERRKLSRVLYTLQVYGMGVVVTKDGVYYEPVLDDEAA